MANDEIEASRVWVVANNPGPVTVNQNFIHDLLAMMTERDALGAKITEGTDQNGNPATYVVGRVETRKLENFNNTLGYFNLLLISTGTLSAIAGASVWDYTDERNPVLVATSDAMGRIAFSNPSSADKFRIISHGHAIRDIVADDGQGALHIESIEPAAFGGTSGNGTSSIWVSKTSGYTIQFSSFGLMRESRRLSELGESSIQQYLLAANTWLPSKIDPSLDSDGYRFLNTRPHSFRSLGGRWMQRIDNFNEFRFPDTTTMIGRWPGGEHEFELLG